MEPLVQHNRSHLRQGRYQPRPGSIRVPRKQPVLSVDGVSTAGVAPKPPVSSPPPAAPQPLASQPDIADTAPAPAAEIVNEVPEPVVQTPATQVIAQQSSPEQSAQSTPADHVSLTTPADSPAPPTRTHRPVRRSAVLKRSTVSKPHLTSSQRKSLLELRDRSLKLLAVVTLVFGLGFALHSWWPIEQGASNQQVLSEVTDQQKLLLEYSEDSIRASEDPVTAADVRRHQVEPHVPRLLKIPDIDLQARVQTVGVNDANQIRMPDNVFDVGWYDGSRSPGQPGVVLLNGHVSGPTERGALHYLRTLKTGDKIQLEAGDGTVYTYEVRDKRTIPYGQVQEADLLSPAEPGARGLNIVAYDTRFNVNANRYQHRTVIYAVQL